MIDKEVTHVRGGKGRVIMIGIPTFGMCHVSFLANMQGLTPPKGFTFFTYFVAPPLDVGEACNKIVRRALEANVSHIYFREDDILTPPGALQRLISLDVDVVEALCMSKQTPPSPIMFGSDGVMLDWMKDPGQPIQVLGTGMGAMLVKIEVFEKLEDPWFKVVYGPTDIGDRLAYRMTQDLYFCWQLFKKDIPVYVDTGVGCTHIDVHSGTSYFFDYEKKCPAWKGSRDELISYIFPIRNNLKAQKLPDTAVASFGDAVAALEQSSEETNSEGLE